MIIVNPNPIPEAYSELISGSDTSFKDLVQMVRNDPYSMNVEVSRVVDAFFADGNYRLLNGTLGKAAKPHVCDWCGMEIPRDSQYMNASVKFDDDSEIFTYKVCIDCLEALQTEDFDGGDDLIEWRRELKNEMEAKL